MAVQTLLVFVVVLGCILYTLWTLMPAAARRFIAKRLVRIPLPSTVAAIFRRAATQTSGCNCSGCDKVADIPHTPPTQATQVIRIHPYHKH